MASFSVVPKFIMTNPLPFQITHRGERARGGMTYACLYNVPPYR